MVSYVNLSDNNYPDYDSDYSVKDPSLPGTTPIKRNAILDDVSSEDENVPTIISRYQPKNNKFSK